MNKVVNRYSIGIGGIFLIACGLFPKLAALISIMPQSVLGGAAVMMFSSIVISGIQLITKWPLSPRNVTIVSVALGVGYGLGSNSAVTCTASGEYQSDLRRFRYRAGSIVCDHSEYHSSEG